MTIDDLVNIYLILATGKYLDNWGAYGSCVDSVDEGAYWMVTTQGQPSDANEDKSNITFYTGICAPSDCSEDDMRNLDDLFTEAAVFNNVSNPQVSYFSVTSYVDNIQHSISTGEAIMWVVILGFMGCIGFGTLIHITKLFDRPGIKTRQENVVVGASDDSNEQNNSEEYKEIQNDDEVDPKEIAKQFNNDTALLYRKQGFVMPLVSSSILRNASKLVSNQKNAQLHPESISQDENTLQMFNGMRFYAMLWIIYAHTYEFTQEGVVSNIKNKPEFFKYFLFTLFPTAYFASDVFFFLSGFIAIYSFLKMTRYTALIILWQYVRRFYRIVPVMAFIMLVAWYVVPRFVEGPQSQRYNMYFSDCKSYWWTNLLLINNFYPNHLNTTCMPWTWYISCDFQMYLLVPILAIVYKKNKMIGYGLTGFLVVLGLILLTALNAGSSYTGANPYLDTKFFSDIYIKPWTRAVPYYMGVGLGASFYFYIKDADSSFFFNKVKHNPLLRGIMYIVGMALMFLMVFVVFDYTRKYGNNWSKGAKTVYMTLSSFLFILGLQMLVLPALLNRAKLIRFLFIGQILNILGRVTYLAALSHPILMIAIYVTAGQQIYVESYKMFATFVGHAFLIYLVS